MHLPAPAIPVVCAIIEAEGLILLAQRPEGKRLAGYWEFPGGKVEPGEEASAALHRELAEELGCTVAIAANGPAVRHDYEWGAIDLHPFLCRLAPDSPAPKAHEHAALKWVGAADLLNETLAPADIPLLKWVLETLNISKF